MILTGKITDFKSILDRQIAYEKKLDNKFRVEMNEFKFVVEKKLEKFDEMFGFWLAGKEEFLIANIDRMVRANAAIFALDPKFKEEILEVTRQYATNKINEIATEKLETLRTEFQELYDQIGEEIISKEVFEAAITEINQRIDDLPAGEPGTVEGGTATHLKDGNGSIFTVDEFLIQILTLANGYGASSGRTPCNLAQEVLLFVDITEEEIRNIDINNLILFSTIRIPLKPLTITINRIDGTLSLSEPLPTGIYFKDPNSGTELAVIPAGETAGDISVTRDYDELYFKLYSVIFNRDYELPIFMIKECRQPLFGSSMRMSPVESKNYEVEFVEIA